MEQLNIPKRPKQEEPPIDPQLMAAVNIIGSLIVGAIPWLICTYLLEKVSPLWTYGTSILVFFGALTFLFCRLYRKRYVNKKKDCVVSKLSIDIRKCRSYKPGQFGRCANLRPEGKCAAEIGWADRVPTKYV